MKEAQDYIAKLSRAEKAKEGKAEGGVAEEGGARGSTAGRRSEVVGNDGRGYSAREVEKIGRWFACSMKVDIHLRYFTDTQTQI